MIQNRRHTGTHSNVIIWSFTKFPPEYTEEKTYTFKQMVLRQLDIHRFKNEFWPYTKVTSKWVKELGIRPETLQLIEEYVGLTFQHDGTGTNFLSKKPKAQERKPRFKSKFKSFCTAKKTNKSRKREPTQWEVFTTCIQGININNSKLLTALHQRKQCTNG